MSHRNQVLIQQFSQLCGQMLCALEENRNLRREVIGLTQDLGSILHGYTNSQQRCLTLQQELINKAALLSQKEEDIIKLQEKIISLETQITHSISRTQTISQNPMYNTSHTDTASSSRNTPNNH
jgi:hypothetical protein